MKVTLLLPTYVYIVVAGEYGDLGISIFVKTFKRVVAFVISQLVSTEPLAHTVPSQVLPGAHMGQSQVKEPFDGTFVHAPPL